MLATNTTFTCCPAYGCRTDPIETLCCCQPPVPRLLHRLNGVAIVTPLVVRICAFTDPPHEISGCVSFSQKERVTPLTLLGNVTVWESVSLQNM